MKALIAAAFVLSWAISAPAHAFTDVCGSDPSNSYCKDVGKTAYNATGAPIMRGIVLGPIVGVAWRPKGSLISAPGSPVRVAPTDRWYYIIGPGGVADYRFIREAREIDAR